MISRKVLIVVVIVVSVVFGVIGDVDAVTQYTPNPFNVVGTGPVTMYYENYSGGSTVTLSSYSGYSDISTYPSWQESGSSCTVSLGAYSFSPSSVGHFGWVSSGNTVMLGWEVTIHTGGLLPDAWNDGTVAFAVNMLVSMTGQSPYTEMRASGSWQYSGGFAISGTMNDNSYGTKTITPTVALSVEVSGPTVVATDVGGTWTGTGSGGTAPYTYKWAYGAIGPFWTYPYSGSTFTKILPEGEWTVECQVTDAVGDTATDDIVVVSTPSIGDGYRYVLQRSGAVGQVMDVWVYDSTTGLAAPIASTADTSIGVYADLDPPNPKSFGWYDNASEASAGAGYAFRWALNITVGGASSPPPVDMWFQSTITLTDTTVMTVTHHFTGSSEVFTGWTDPDGVPIAPEVPPPEESVLPDWLQALLDVLYVLLAPIIFVFEVIKAVVTWIVGMLGYIVYAVGIVIAFGALAATWLGTIIATVLNFSTAAPGAYVSLAGIMTLAGVSSSGVPGDTSVFAGVGFTASSLDSGLSTIHAWMMQSSMAWIWWAIFTFLLIGLVLNMGSKDSEEE
jgi:hypothetical protein